MIFEMYITHFATVKTARFYRRRPLIAFRSAGNAEAKANPGTWTVRTRFIAKERGKIRPGHVAYARRGTENSFRKNALRKLKNGLRKQKVRAAESSSL